MKTICYYGGYGAREESVELCGTLTTRERCIRGDTKLIVNDENEMLVLNDQGGNIKAGGLGYSKTTSPTLKSTPSGGNTVPDIICYEHHPQDSRVKTAGGVVPAINAQAGTGGNNLPLVQSVFPINGMALGKELKDGDRQCTGIGDESDPQFTTLAAHHHAIAIAENIIRKVENGGNGVGAEEEIAYTQNATGVMGISNPTVRRLMPIECERLMGFPDNYTQIPWRGKPAEECPDSLRYKACGNSMGVNVMRWIGLGIQASMQRIKNID